MSSLCVFPLAIAIPIPVVPPAAWQASHVYAVDTLVVNGPNIYKCVVAGTSAASGGPTGTGSGIADNTVTWDWVAPLPVVPPIPPLVFELPVCVLDEF